MFTTDDPTERLSYIAMPSYGQAHIVKYLSHTNFFPLYDREGMVFFKITYCYKKKELRLMGLGNTRPGRKSTGRNREGLG